MQNSLIDLNNHLFAAIERLNDEDLKADNLEQEITRANAICGVATQVIENSKVLLKAVEVKAEYGVFETLPEVFVENKKQIAMQKKK